MGFGVLVVEGQELTLVDVGVITTTTDRPFANRLALIAADLRSLMKHHHPDLLAIEKLFLSNNQKTAMQVAEARGVVLLLAAEAKLPVIEVTPNQVKSALTGDGSAKKGSVQTMVKYLLKLPRAPKPDDAADAIAIAITASTMRL